MCGRFDFHGSSADMAALFQELITPTTLGAHYNLAPTDAAPVVTQATDTSPVALKQMTFGWTRPHSFPPRILNARQETVTTRPLFRAAIAGRRCVVPASGFFEWRARGKLKQPFYFSPRAGGLMGLAGLWAPGERGGAGQFVILTCEANAAVRPYHGRMPVVLSPDALARWLAPRARVAALTPFLVPSDADAMAVWPVSRAMNRPSFGGPLAIAPTSAESPATGSATPMQTPKRSA